jgi:hypothetical protein
MRAPLLLLVLCRVAAADVTAPDAADPAPPPATVALDGPYASLDEICAREVRRRAEHANFVPLCRVTPRTAHAAVVKILDDLDDGRADGYLALRTDDGWFLDREPADFMRLPQELLLHDNLRYTFLIAGLDERSGAIVLRAVHAVFVNSDHPYHCVGLEVTCRLDDAGRRPRCSEPQVVARKARCDPTRGPHWPAITRPPRALTDWRSWDWFRPSAAVDQRLNKTSP